MRSQTSSCNNNTTDQNKSLFSKVQQLSFQSSFFTSISDFQQWLTSQASKNSLQVDDGFRQIASKLQKCSSEIIQYLNYTSPTSKRLDPETRFTIYSSSFSMISQRYELGRAAQVLKQIMLISPSSSYCSQSSSSPSSSSTNVTSEQNSSNKLLEPTLFETITNLIKNIISPIIQFILLALHQVYSFVLVREVDSQKWNILNSKLHALSIIFRQMIEPVVQNSQFDGQLIHNSLFYMLKQSLLVPLCQNQVLLLQEKQDMDLSPIKRCLSDGLLAQIDQEQEETVSTPMMNKSKNKKRFWVPNTISRCGFFKLNQWNQLWQILDLEESDFESLIKEYEKDQNLQVNKNSSSLANEDVTQIAREISTQTPSDSTSPLLLRGINSLRREKSTNSCMLTNRKSSTGILSQPMGGNQGGLNQNIFSSQGPIMSSFESIPELCLSYSQTSNSQIISQRDAWYDSIGEDLKSFELKPLQTNLKQKLKKGKSKSSPTKDKNNSEIREMLSNLKNKRKQQLKEKLENEVKVKKEDNIDQKPPKEYQTPIRKKFNKRTLKGGSATIVDEEQDTFFQGNSPVFQKETIQQGEYLVSKDKSQSPGRVLEIPDTPQNIKKKRFMGFKKSNFGPLF